MSVYFNIRLTIRGDDKILDEFVNYFKSFESFYIENGEYDSDKYYMDMFCYIIKADGDNLSEFLNIQEFSEKFPSLKFEYIEGGESMEIAYQIYQNGKCLEDYYRRNIFWDLFLSHEYEDIDVTPLISSQEYDNHCDVCCHRREITNYEFICQECQEFLDEWEISWKFKTAFERIRIAIETKADSLIIEDPEIKELPRELWKMHDLRSMEIRNCYQLENIPSDISQLTHLENLKILRSKITSLPEEFWQLRNLTSLDFTVCPNLKTIPEEICQLQKLESLNITGCKSLESLPASVCQLNQLKVLSIMNCENLHNLPKELMRLSNLKVLRIIKCENLSFALDIEDLPSLTYLEMDDDWWILEEEFPQAILDNALGYNLRVINSNHETVAYFYNIGAILSEKNFSSQEAFCSFYDQIYEDYVSWDRAGLNPEFSTPEDQEKDYQKVIQNLQLEPGILMTFKAREDILNLMGLYRLAYPYHCKSKRVKDAMLQIECEVVTRDIFSLDDIQVARKAFELGWIEFTDMLLQIIEKEWIYEHPDYWLTDENIDYSIDYASQETLTGLTAFLLDYKNKVFTHESRLSLESKPHAESDLWETRLNIDGSLTITKYNGSETAVEIPGAIGNKKVKQIAGSKKESKSRSGSYITVQDISESIFLYKAVKMIKIKEGVEVVGPYAFFECDQLKSIELPPGLQKIHSSAFAGCQNLKEINLPMSLEWIGEYSFYGCSQLKSINLPQGLQRVPNGAFAGCQNLKAINLPRSLQWIGDYSFPGCHNLESIMIPEGIKEIREYTFNSCGLLSIKLPNGIEWIGPKAFGNCKYLSSIFIPEKVVEISDDAFQNCEILTFICKNKSYAHQYANDNDIPFVEADLVYGLSPLGLLFMPESRAEELAKFYSALITAKTWGEFREMVSKKIYEFYLLESMHYQGPSGKSDQDLRPFYIPDEKPFNPNDIFSFDYLPGDPQIEMARWIPKEIQEKFGRRFSYIAEDMNVPAGEALSLDENKVDEIVQALEERGFVCQRDDELILAATTSDFDPEEFDDFDEGSK